MTDKEYKVNQVFNEFLLLEKEVTGAGMDVNSQLAIRSIMAVSRSPERSISSYLVTPSTLGSYTAKSGNNVEVTSPSDSVSSMASLVTLTSPNTSPAMVASPTTASASPMSEEVVSVDISVAQREILR